MLPFQPSKWAGKFSNSSGGAGNTLNEGYNFSFKVWFTTGFAVLWSLNVPFNSTQQGASSATMEVCEETSTQPRVPGHHRVTVEDKDMLIDTFTFSLTSAMPV